VVGQLSDNAFDGIDTHTWWYSYVNQSRLIASDPQTVESYSRIRWGWPIKWIRADVHEVQTASNGGLLISVPGVRSGDIQRVIRSAVPEWKRTIVMFVPASLCWLCVLALVRVAARAITKRV
jgi:hypothetical protein